MNTKNIFLIVFLLTAFTLGGYWLGSTTGSDSETMSSTNEDMSSMDSPTSSKKASGQNDEREILYWQAPMNPSEVYENPGKSNMGMDLIPVYADEANSSEGMVSINPVVEQNMNVRTAPVRQMDLSTTISAVGKVEYDEQKLYNVNPKISGWIEELYVNYTGKMVQKGQPLFSLYSPELVTTQREYLLALKNKNKVENSSFSSIRKGGNSLLEATRKRLEYWDIPESEIQRLEDTGKISKTVTLEAPATGMILHKNAVEGEHIKAGTPAYKIANLSSIWVQASVYDYEIPWIQEGQTATMKLSYQPGKTYTGSVDYIYPSLEEKSRTIQVRLEFPNPDIELKPGMFANVQIQSRPKQNVTVIPGEAIIRTGERNLVFIARGKGKFEPREVTLGMEGGDRNNEIEVLSGLKPGELVVTSAQFLFDSESRLQEAIQKMLDQKNTSHTGMDPSQMNMNDTSDDKINTELEEMSDAEMEKHNVSETDL